MIIIKSQYNVIFTELKNICPSGGEIIANYKDLEVSDGMGGTTTTINYDLLADYKSEERAKEVMGMIEEHINFIEHIRLFGNLQYFKGKIKPANEGLIFIMPAE